MSIKDVSAAITPWVCVIPADSHAESPVNLEYLREKLQEFSSNRNNEGKDFMEGESKGEDEQVGFRTFCKLCDAIIEDFENVSI